MNKLIIGALVGGLILFVWQFLSWSMLNIHRASMTYTPNQDKILDVLEANLEEGTYFIPNLSKDATAEDREAYTNERMGKPWAMVSYHEAMDMSFGMNLVRGFVTDVLAVFLLCWLLMKIDRLDLKTALLSSLAVGLIGYLSINYINQVWFESDSIPHLIDAIVQWGLCGLWLGLYLRND